MEHGDPYQLMAPLLADDRPEPPPRYDVDAAIRTGRHRATVRAAVAGAAAFLLVAAAVAVPVVVNSLSHDRVVTGPTPAPVVTGPPGPTADCVGTGLTAPQTDLGVFSTPTGAQMDPTGRYIVATFIDESVGSVGGAKSVLWDGGVATVLPVGIGQVGAIGVNSDGTVVGGGSLGDSARAYTQPWIYRGGTWQYLARPSNIDVSPRAIDSAGNVYGESAEGFVFWPADALDAPEVIAGTAGDSIGGVTDDGMILGSAGPTDRLPALWRHTGDTWTRQYLPTGDFGRSGMAFGFANGLAVGYVKYGDAYGFHAAIWHPGEAGPLLVGGTGDFLIAVTAGGDAIGGHIGAPQTDMKPLRYHDGVLAELPAPSSGDGVGGSRSATGISADGHTVVGMSDVVVDVWHC